MRITLLIDRISGAGGVQRMLAMQVNHWASLGHEICIMTLDCSPGESYFHLDKAISVRHSELDGQKYLPIPKTKTAQTYIRLRKLLQDTKPDLVLGMKEVGGIFALISLFGTRIPVVVVEHSHPRLNPLPNRLKLLRDKFYPFAFKLVLLNSRLREMFPTAIRDRSVIIPNPILPPSANGPPMVACGRQEGRKYVISVGRLDEVQKRQDRLIDAFSMIAKSFPDWDLEIWGEGPQRSVLDQQVQKSGMEGRVFFRGVTQDIDSLLQSSQLFVLSSAYEAQPLVLGEAMANGTPVISFDCETGPRELINPGYDGVLVPDGDVGKLAQTMSELMLNEPTRIELGLNAKKVVERFSFESIMSLWDELFSTVRKN